MLFYMYIIIAFTTPTVTQPYPADCVIEIQLPVFCKPYIGKTEAVTNTKYQSFREKPLTRFITRSQQYEDDIVNLLNYTIVREMRTGFIIKVLKTLVMVMYKGYKEPIRKLYCTCNSPDILPIKLS